MLPKKNRATKKLIDRIFKEGRFISSSNLVFKFVKETKSPTRVSFICPKTVSKKAVDRNLLRRRGYAILNKKNIKLPIGIIGAFVFGKKSMEVFGGRKNRERNPSKNLENEIKNILNKIY